MPDAWDRGIGAVINGQEISQSSVVREHANIPDDQIIVTVAIGYPTDDFPANDIKSERRPTDDIVNYIGFDTAADADVMRGTSARRAT